MTTTQRRDTAVDWRGWYDRWEAQQSHYMPHREERFQLIIDAVASICGARPHVVDLGCGPGSLAIRILESLPGAEVTAIDMDPVLLRIGREVFGDQMRLRFIDADLRSPWEAELHTNRVDAAVSTTALHWLQPSALRELYGRLAADIPAGGAFVNGDHLGFAANEPLLTAAARGIADRQRMVAPSDERGEDWDEWWSAVETEPGLATEVALRRERVHDHPDHDHQAGLEFQVDALRQAGFAEVGPLWQRLTDRVLVAIR